MIDSDNLQGVKVTKIEDGKNDVIISFTETDTKDKTSHKWITLHERFFKDSKIPEDKIQEVGQGIALLFQGLIKQISETLVNPPKKEENKK